MSDVPAKTPITDLLADVPADARVMYEHHSTYHQNIPFGWLAKEALDEISRLKAEMEKAEAERDAAKEDVKALERLMQGQERGVEHLQRELEKAEAKRDELREALEEIREIYAGMDGFIPETAPEGYLQRIIEKMWAEVRDALTQEQEKEDG